jgi:hypothetical protein
VIPGFAAHTGLGAARRSDEWCVRLASPLSIALDPVVRPRRSEAPWPVVGELLIEGEIGSGVDISEPDPIATRLGLGPDKMSLFPETLGPIGRQIAHENRRLRRVSREHPINDVLTTIGHDRPSIDIAV